MSVNEMTMKTILYINFWQKCSQLPIFCY